MRRESEREATRWMRSLRTKGGGPLLVAVAAPLLSGLLLVAQAMVLANILGRAVGEAAPLDALAPALALLGGLLTLRVLLGLIGETAAVDAAERIKLALRGALLARLLAAQPNWSGERSSGALAAAAIDRVEALDGFYARFLPASIAAATLPVAFAGFVLSVDWVAGLLFLVTAPLIPVFMALVGWGAQAASDAQATAFSRLSGHFADRLRGLVTLTLFGRGEAEAEACERATDELRRRTLRVLRIAFLSSAVLEFFAALGVAGVALYVGLTYLGFVDLRAAPLSLEAGLFCLLMAPEVYQPLRNMAAHYHDRASAKAAVAEIARLFDGLPALDAVPPAANAATTLGPSGIEASGLSVALSDGSRTIIDRADLSVPAGGRVALVGPSGIGKSTLIEALARLRAAEGTIRIGGRPLDAIDEATLRETLAFVPQRPHLVCGTIAENIGFGRPGADPAAIRAAAAQACVTDFADALPGGLDTPVGENGLGLSGGEAQRVALARLYLRDPTVILLDEPTAHLDAETARRVTQGLLDFARGRTLLVATHSAALAARMDRTLRLADGRLVPVPASRPIDASREDAA